MSTSSPRIVFVTTIPMTLDYFFRPHVRYLKRQGCEIHLVCSPGERLSELGKEEDVQTHGVPISRRVSPLQDCRARVTLVRSIRRIKPDIVHVCTPKANLLGPIAARMSNVPIVVSSVFGLPQMTSHGVMKRVLDLVTRIGCRLSNRVWCDSRSMADYIVEQGFCTRSKVITLGDGSVAGIDAASRFSPKGCEEAGRLVREEFGIPTDAVLFGFVGRVANDKGMNELASAWTTVRERSDSEHLLLAGRIDARDPPLPESLRAFERDPRVHLAGSRSDVPSLLAAMDIFVMPSYREGFGVSNLEASAMGLPIVSTRIPGCVDSVVDGITGLLVPPQDSVALADAMLSYVEEAHLRKRHGLAGRERALKEFQPEVLCAALHREYRRLLAHDA